MLQMPILKNATHSPQHNSQRNGLFMFCDLAPGPESNQTLKNDLIYYFTFRSLMKVRSRKFSWIRGDVVTTKKFFVGWNFLYYFFKVTCTTLLLWSFQILLLQCTYLPDENSEKHTSALLKLIAKLIRYISTFYTCFIRDPKRDGINLIPVTY